MNNQSAQAPAHPLNKRREASTWRSRPAPTRTGALRALLTACVNTGGVSGDTHRRNARAARASAKRVLCARAPEGDGSPRGERDGSRRHKGGRTCLSRPTPRTLSPAAVGREGKALNAS
ncbi:hypothetical protein AAFF_G00206250 [Aldrovandia affinis]|uniref:Uncharacterized protein n=1 Tax=Aldrovandia affinis TaxID=143900 RepID=A0AAD7W5D3_9TELE|nr:hypothetical protein AAFF_G00206250 [Aldrovandia affinis]